MPKSRDIQLKLRLLAREKRDWTRAAKRARVNLSTWIREACEMRRRNEPTPVAKSRVRKPPITSPTIAPSA